MPGMSSFHSYCITLLLQAVQLTIAHMGTTALALVIGWLRNVAEYRKQAMSARAPAMPEQPTEKWWKQWWRERKLGIKLSLKLWLLLFLYFAVRSGYDDFHQVDGERSKAANELAQLQDYAKHKKEYDEQLAWAKGEVQQWQEAYQRCAKGETQPDRKMSSEEESALYDALARISKGSTKNNDFLKIQIGASCGIEPRRFKEQIWQAFDRAHWPVPPNPRLNKAQLDGLNKVALEGITIFTDQMRNGMYLQAILREAHVDSQVATFEQMLFPPIMNMKGTIIWVGDK
jgi:hypothetical protein